MHDARSMRRWLWLLAAVPLASGCRCGALPASESTDCRPSSCAELGSDCGEVADGCGGTLRCGVCGEGLVCGGGGAPNVCAPFCDDGWCWQNPLPQGNALLGVWRSPRGALWTVGANGVVLRHDGEQWHRVPSPTPRNLLHAVWGAADDDVWVAGKGLWHWDGARWTGALDAGWFLSVRGVSSNDVWALGQTAVFHFDGRAWTQTAAVDGPLTALWVRSATEVWAVGYAGVVLRWDGVRWTALPGLPTSHHLHGVSGTSARDVWVVGMQVDAQGGGTSLIEHWDGVRWTAAPTPTWPETNTTWYRAVLARSPTDVWVAGINGTVLQWNGARWRSVPSGTRVWLYALAASAEGRVWAVGDGGAVWEWTGGAYLSLAGEGASSLDALWGSSAVDVWAAGWEGAALHFDGRRWTPAVGLNLPRADRGAPGTLPNLSHLALWGTLRDDVWASDRVSAGPSLLQHFDGVSWSPVPLPATARPVYLSSGCATSPTDAWAVGTTVLRWDGAVWREEQGDWPGLAEAFCLGSTSLWAVGTAADGTGRVLHWDGAAFSTSLVTAEATLQRVYARADGDVWVTGTSRVGTGLVFHFDGSSWSKSDWTSAVAGFDVNDVNAQFTAVIGDGREVWVATNVGFVLHWDGQRWTRLATAKQGFLSRLWRARSGELWASGSDGTLLFRAPP